MYPIPSGYDGGSVLQKVEQSVQQAEVNESAQAREDGGMKSMMDYVCSEKNVWTPKYVGHTAYPWVYQIPLALQKILYHAGFVLKAITNKMEDVSGTVCRMRSTVRKNQLSLE